MIRGNRQAGAPALPPLFGLRLGPPVQRTPYTSLGTLRNHSRVHGAFGASSVRATRFLQGSQQTARQGSHPRPADPPPEQYLQTISPPELRAEAPPECLIRVRVRGRGRGRGRGGGSGSGSRGRGMVRGRGRGRGRGRVHPNLPLACLCVSWHVWRVPSAELRLELLHDLLIEG